LMLRTGWFVVRLTVRVSSPPRSMVIVSTATWAVTTCPRCRAPASGVNRGSLAQRAGATRPRGLPPLPVRPLRLSPAAAPAGGRPTATPGTGPHQAARRHAHRPSPTGNRVILPALQCEAGQGHVQERCRLTRDDLRSALRVILPGSGWRLSEGCRGLTDQSRAAVLAGSHDFAFAVIAGSGLPCGLGSWWVVRGAR
jgi:hypothetical protein